MTSDCQKLSSDDEIVAKALEYAQAEHEKIMALLRISPTSVSKPSIPATTTLAAIAQLAPTHLVGSMTVFQRIYVGSVQFDISEKDLELLFSQFGPIRRIDMMQDPVHRRHRGFGFIEFETPEAAALAQAQMDGAELGGRTIKVGRPNNFPADLPPGIPRPLPNRIYVGNVHELVQEAELKLIFEAFGKINYCHLAPNPIIGRHREYGYVEYESEKAAATAIASLNNFELAKRLLKVGRTISGGPMPAGMESLKDASTSNEPAVRAKVPTAVLRAAEEINASLKASSIPTSPPPLPSLPLSPSFDKSHDTTVVALRNLEDYSNLNDKESIKELEIDVAEECARFGNIALCKVQLDHDQQTVTVLVKFESKDSLIEALKVMHLRWFGGRQIIAEPFDQLLFDQKYYGQ